MERVPVVSRYVVLHLDTVKTVSTFLALILIIQRRMEHLGDLVKDIVILHCDETYLPSHAFYGPSFRPRWESDWKISQGGIVCSDGKWIGLENDRCDVTATLTSVEIYWNKIQGLLTLWDNGEWRIASSPPNIRTFRRSCTSVGIHQTRYLRYALTSKSQIKVTCSKLRLTEPNPTPHEGRIEAYNHINGNWEGVCHFDGTIGFEL